MPASGVENASRREEWAAVSAAELLAEADRCGLSVFTDGDRLVVRGPKGADQDLVRALLRRKAEVMPLLAWGADDVEHFEERAAIAEWDGGSSREAAERLARAEVDARRRADRLRSLT